jgi:predicted RNA methylase
MALTTKQIPVAVLEVLAAGTSSGNAFFLPPGQLDRKLYQAVDQVLQALGSKWNRSRSGHVFGGLVPGEAVEAADRIAAAVASGSYDDPKALAFFETPSALAAQLVAEAGVRRGDRCLEPSAGEAAIARWLAAAGGLDNLVCVEVNAHRQQRLIQKGFNPVYGGDFLSMQPPTDDVDRFARIVMNPPFSLPGQSQADIEHVTHALRFLAPGGSLVAVISRGVLFRGNARTRDFVELVNRHKGSIGLLPDDAFEVSGTSVRTAVLRVGC